MSYANPNINGSTPCDESRQVDSLKHPARPIPPDASGPFQRGDAPLDLPSDIFRELRGPNQGNPDGAPNMGPTRYRQSSWGTED